MRLFLLAALCLLSVCSHATDTTQVLILQVNEPVPAGAKKVGDVKISDGGFKMNCGYDRTMEQAKEKTIKKGGNLLKITELKKPDAWSSCYRLRGEVYQLDDIRQFMTAKNNAIDSALKALMPENASYAMLYVYRPKSSIGTIIQYNLHADDSLLCRIKNGSRYLVKLPHTGETKIWARTEGREEISLDIEAGKVYFLRCAVRMGAFVGRPSLTLVDPATGFTEYQLLEKSGKDNDKDVAETESK